MLNERILVTGATGCLGSNLVKHLIGNGADIVVFKRHGESLGPLERLRRSFEVRFGDVCDLVSLKKSFAGIRQVYHLAGIAIPLNRYDRQMWEVNVFGTYNVLQAAVSNSVQRVVHVSSTAAVGYPPNGFLADETFSFADSVESNSYAVTKRRGEEIALGFNSKSLEVVVVNPSAVIAPGGSRYYGWAAVMEAARRGRMFIYPPGGSAFCSRQDLIDGLIRAMNSGLPGQRYIVSSANVSYFVLASMIAEIVGVRAPWIPGPRWLFDAVGHLNDFASMLQADPARPPMLVSENTKLMSRSLFYNQAKSVEFLGVSQTGIAHALCELHEWCRLDGAYVFV